MRRLALVTSLLALSLAPAIATAKLPFFGMEVDPRLPDVGEPITLTMTCFDDAGHSVPTGSCLGAGGTMAWIHPLDEHGEFDRDDWIEVVGHATAGGSTRAKVVLTEPGGYDVLPLYRGWGYEHGRGFPRPIRLEVGRRGHPVTLAVAMLGVAAAGLVTVRRRRFRRQTTAA
jgi:hypothetical protein